MNNFLNGLTDATNYTLTANGGLAHKTTKSMVLDMFATGAAYRKRTDEDCILLFKNAYAEDPTRALRCLFYIRDAREGQGERRYFRVVVKWLANYDTDAVRRNLENIPYFGRWDDLYCLFDTPLEKEMLEFITKQLALDVMCNTPSLLAKWLPSENTSSMKTRALATKIRKHLGWSHKQYRKTLSILRARINVLERLMSAGRWDEIEFDKIPSKAGFKYRNAFARRDMIKAKYEAFAKSAETKVNAKTLYPYECVAEARKLRWDAGLEDTNRLMINKYWDNLENYFNDAVFNGMAVVDVSGSMFGADAAAPINVSISLGLYCAEKAKGPFANHFLTFSAAPNLVKVEGVDFCDKVKRMGGAEWGMNTNLEACFDLLLNTAIRNGCSQEELPENLLVISDMQIDAARSGWGMRGRSIAPVDTMMETMRKKWAAHGYQLPRLVYWNVNAGGGAKFLDNDPNVSYISGFSPTIFQQLMSGKTGYELMLEVLDSERYAVIK